MEDSIPNIPEITERQSMWTQGYTIFDPCNTNKAGNQTRNCSQKKRRENSTTGVYEIYIRDDPVNVRCDMDSDGGGWTVIQRQSEDEKNVTFFERNMEDYRSGFGTAEGSFWIGLENLHSLTSYPNNQQALRIVLERHDERKEKTAVYYNKFHVASKEQNYKLTIEGYVYNKGKGYDAMSGQNGTDFSVNLNTEAKHEEACFEKTLTGGWWFKVKECNYANLNGRKLDFVGPTTWPRGIAWYKTEDTKSYEYTYDKVEMQIRDADFGFCTGSLKF
uniref:Putative ixoderin b5 n=1 Tax=Ixodes ricinus TaxID=34613 RepID=A0A6B0V5K6_IXORI